MITLDKQEVVDMLHPMIHQYNEKILEMDYDAYLKINVDASTIQFWMREDPIFIDSTKAIFTLQKRNKSRQYFVSSVEFYHALMLMEGEKMHFIFKRDYVELVSANTSIRVVALKSTVKNANV